MINYDKLLYILLLKIDKLVTFCMGLYEANCGQFDEKLIKLIKFDTRFINS